MLGKLDPFTSSYIEVASPGYFNVVQAKHHLCMQAHGYIVSDKRSIQADMSNVGNIQVEFSTSVVMSINLLRLQNANPSVTTFTL